MALLTREVEAAVARLRTALDPEEIVLFGSRARGTARPDSDADLLVVLRAGGAPSAERQALAWRTAQENTAPAEVTADVFAYTPEDLRRRLAAGSTVVRDALAEGVVLYPRPGGSSHYAQLAKEWSRVGAVNEWLGFAEEDLGDAEALCNRAHPVWRNVAYHAQQAAEKAIKALILHLGGPLNRTHDILALLLAVSTLDRPLGTRLALSYGNAGAALTPFAVKPRYPGDTAVTEQQAKEALTTAQGIVSAVRSIVAPNNGM